MARGRRAERRLRPRVDEFTARGSARRTMRAGLTTALGWPGKAHDSPQAESLLKQASDIMLRTSPTGSERHALADQADLLLEQALGVNASTSTSWGHLTALPFNASPPRPTCADFRVRRRELRASLARLGVDAAAARLGSSETDLSGLRRGLQRCVHEGEAYADLLESQASSPALVLLLLTCLAADWRRLSVVTLGCSMSEGQMSCWGHDLRLETSSTRSLSSPPGGGRGSARSY